MRWTGVHLVVDEEQKRNKARGGMIQQIQLHQMWGNTASWLWYRRMNGGGGIVCMAVEKVVISLQPDRKPIHDTYFISHHKLAWRANLRRLRKTDQGIVKMWHSSGDRVGYHLLWFGCCQNRKCIRFKNCGTTIHKEPIHETPFPIRLNLAKCNFVVFY